MKIRMREKHFSITHDDVLDKDAIVDLPDAEAQDWIDKGWAELYAEPMPQASAHAILSSARQTINADDPVVIMSVDIVLTEPSRVMIEGVVNGTFYHVCGFAAYVNDAPINLGTGNNRCHPDCFQVMYGNGNNGWMVPMPFKTVTDELPAGTHTIGLGVIAKWAGTKRPLYINSRSTNDMASSSSLIVRTI